MSKDNKEKTLQETIAEVMRELIPATVAAASVASKGPAQAPNPRTHPEKCPECRQLKIACKGEHVEMVVFPRNTRFASQFEGVFTNGVRYLSDHPGHKITVPKENDIAGVIAAWEQGEENTLQGRQGKISDALKNFNAGYAF